MKFIGTIAVIAFLAVFGGFTISVLWGWFIVPLGVVSLSIPHAIGINTTLGVFQIRATKEEVKIEDAVIKAISFYVAALIIGYITHLFM